MTKRFAIFAAVFCAGLELASAQPPAPPPPGAASMPMKPATISGVVSQLNYAPDGSIDGFIVSGNALVHLPPEWMARFGNTLRPRERVAVTGQLMPGAGSNMQVLDAQSLRVAGRTFSMPESGASAPCGAINAPPPPPRPVGPGGPPPGAPPPPPPPVPPVS